MHRLQKLLVVLLLLGCVVGVASAAVSEQLPITADATAGTAVSFEFTIENILGNGQPATVTTSVMVPVNMNNLGVTVTERENVDGAIVFNAGAVTELTAGTWYPVAVTLTPETGQVAKVVLQITGTPLADISAGSSIQTMVSSVTGVSSAPTVKADAKQGTTPIANEVTVTVDPAVVNYVDNGGADDGLALLAAAQATPTANVTATPTVDITVVPTATVTGDATAVPTDVPSTPTASVTGGQGTGTPTPTQAPAPILGILAGLGVAALILRRN